MTEAIEIDFVVEDKAAWTVRSYTEPVVGEVIQINRKDYVVKQRFWAVDYLDTHACALRVIIGLEEKE